MTRIESQQVTISKSTETIFNFISDFNNFKDLMPDSVEDLETTQDSCSFTIKGMPTIKLKIGEKIPYSFVSMIAEGGQIPFSLNCQLENDGEHSKAQLFFEAELNTMMKMMVEKPLTNFLNILIERLKNIK